MQFDSNPIYRKIIVPWYDSKTVCFILIAFMIMVLLFGAVGILAARETPDYHEHTWLPVFLVLMSSFVIISTGIRLAKRYIYQFKEEV